MTLNDWLEENNGMPVDTREIAERLCNDRPEGAEDLLKLASNYVMADILFFQEL